MSLDEKCSVKFCRQIADLHVSTIPYCEKHYGELQTANLNRFMMKRLGVIEIVDEVKE